MTGASGGPRRVCRGPEERTGGRPGAGRGPCGPAEGGGEDRKMTGPAEDQEEYQRMTDAEDRRTRG